MRQIGTLRKESDALRLVDYLFTEGIRAHAEADRDDWVIWVRDENDLDRGRDELENFSRSPDDARYAHVAAKADSIRKEEILRRQRSHDNTVQMGGRWRRPITQRSPLVVTMIGFSLLMFLLSGLGMGNLSLPVRWLGFVDKAHGQDPNWDGDGLTDISRGQIWRVVTPIFLHGGLLHILFNMYMLFHLGAAVETQRGWWRFALLVLVIAVVSNLGEYFLGYQLNLTDSRALSAGMNPYFGGMSGVVYGIFGYIWMKSRHDPQSGFHLDQMTVVILLGWFVACFFMTGIANGAHGFGLAVGMIIGYGRIL